jgi:hypothetical protein
VLYYISFNHRLFTPTSYDILLQDCALKCRKNHNDYETYKRIAHLLIVSFSLNHFFRFAIFFSYFSRHSTYLERLKEKFRPIREMATSDGSSDEFYECESPSKINIS